MKKFLLLPISFLLLCFSTSCGDECADSLVNDKAQLFPLDQVELLESPFSRAMELDKKWLLDLKVDRLLYQYRVTSGLAPKDSSYQGWEIRFAGQTLGHYLSACSMMYASTGDVRFKNKMEYILSELKLCQDQHPDGYVGGVRNGPQLFKDIKNGVLKLEYNGFKLNNGWVPWYIMHKLFAGLIDSYQYTHNQLAKKILIKLSDWCVGLFENMSDEKIQEMLLSESGGMNESLAAVYDITKDKRYLDLSKRFNYKVIVDPLFAHKDELDGHHANSQIPKIIGILKQYEMTGDSALFNAADFFWNTIIDRHSYVIGGNAESEYWSAPDTLNNKITDFTSENCGTYNMLKLTKELNRFAPSVHKIDYYERALYNQILASQNPETGMVTYFAGMAYGSTRHYCSSDHTFWCCTGTGFENHAKYGEFIYTKKNTSELFVNLFIPSVLHWKEKGLTLTQKSNYPLSDNVEYKFNLVKKSNFSFNLRYPSWADKGFEIQINGKRVEADAQPGQFITIHREWADGDVLTYSLPKSLRTESILGEPSTKAFLYGPIVLAAELEKDFMDKEYPVVVTKDEAKLDYIETVDESNMLFKLHTSRGALKLKPYYLIDDSYTAVYFKHLDPKQYAQTKKDYALTRFATANIQKRTTDKVICSNANDELKHGLKASTSTLVKSHLGTGRTILGGCFSYEVSVSKTDAMGIVCDFILEPSSDYDFDIYVDDDFLTNVRFNKEDQVQKIRRYYNLILDYTLDKDKVTLYFKAKNGKKVAPLSSAIMLTQK